MSEVKKETVPATLTADDYRRKIVRMVSGMGNVKWLKFIYDFTYAFYLDNDCDVKGGEQE